MALTTCKECSAQVSDTALICPQCGAKLKSPKRGPFGVAIKWIFILFNIFMLWAMLKGCGTASESINTGETDAEKAGAAIGTGIGIGILLFIWAGGAVVLGFLTLFTRPKN